MSFSQPINSALASSAPVVWRARYSRSFTQRPNSCSEPSARALSTAPRLSANSASYRLVFHCPANCPRLASVWCPMPRLGVLTARKKAGSSSWLTSRRSHAHRSLISARSKKLWPPDTLYGMAALRSAFSNTRAWWLARYSTAKSRNCTGSACRPESASAPPCPRSDWMRATARSASCSSPSHSSSCTGSPSPKALHSFLSNSFGLFEITALAARRMWPVER